jgi:hypothetical protein
MEEAASSAKPLLVVMYSGAAHFAAVMEHGGTIMGAETQEI